MNDAGQQLRLLVVEDNEGDARLLHEMLKDNPAKPTRFTHVKSMREAEAHLAAGEVDIIVLDIGLPDAQGLGAVRRAHEAAPRVPLIVLTGLDDEALAARSLQEGAQDYLPKNDITMPSLFRALRYAIERKMIEEELRIETERARRSTERLRLATEHSGVGVWDWNIIEDQLTWDPWMGRLYGLSPEDRIVSYELWSRRIHPEDRAAVALAAAAAIAGKQPFDLEFRVVWPDASVQHIRALGQVTRDAAGYAVRMVGINWDVTETRRLAAELAAQHELLEVTLQSIGDAVVCTDTLGNVTFSNAMAAQLTGHPAGQTKGPPMAEIVRMIGAGAAGGGGSVELPENYTLTRQDGAVIPVEGCIAPIRGRGGEEAGKVIVFRDVSAARAAAQAMTHRAHHDMLTGLPNRLLLADRIDQAIAMAPRHGKKVAVLFLDLDGFKQINDTLGHAAGDELLKSVARRLSGCVRASDTVSRQGGDEFVVLLAEVGETADAAITARRMLTAVGEAHGIDGQDLQVTTSIGVSVYPDDGPDAESLIKAADIAMYQAKSYGKQCYQFFEPAMRARANERQSIEEGLRVALERGEFALHYQPKVRIETGQITGAEALLRWTHPKRGPIAPADFIPVAEDCGLIRAIGAWVLREACQQARKWAGAGWPDFTLAVNVSAVEFRDEQFTESVRETLAETGFDAAHLELELTEAVLMKRAAGMGGALRALKESGVRLAIDDFGTGYSSLSHLTNFQIDTVKIDLSVVRRISAAETAIVTAVIGMAHGLNLKVVAEGVETREELEFLAGQQCDEAQGHYFSRPLPAPAFAKLLAKPAAPGAGRVLSRAGGRA
jgi:diguanylate cyclase (GGDEF)-like protein/PAS domain S-box-containing protein